MGIRSDVDRALSPEPDWGSWGLGDLADAARRAAEVLGSALVVSWVSIEPPQGDREVPRVRVLVRDAETAESLRAQFVVDEPLPQFTGDPFGAAWSVDVDEIQVCLSCQQSGGEQ